MTSERTLTLESVRTCRHALVMRFGFQDLSFSTTYWYQDVDFHALRAWYSDETVDRLAFHIALFEMNKLCSLRPDRLELGPWARFLTGELTQLWRTILHHVWAQWRYENGDPDYRGPHIGHPYGPPGTPISSREHAPNRILALCGGGKDSLVTMRLLERVGLAYDSLVYSSSIYGPAQAQHELAGGLVDRCRPVRRMRQWIYDDFMDSPVLALHPELGIRTLTAAETPSSIMGVLPVALAHGHAYLCLGHERSAETGQVRWKRTGEDVNHQWGKSLEALLLIGRYIRGHLLADVHCFSPLKPIYDPVIFAQLRRMPDDVPYTHSCNLRKPWCLACPKCLYVWLGYAAFLPRERVRATFGADDLLARPALAPMFRALLGLDGKQPFECIGGPGEVAIFLAACLAKGYAGPPMEMVRERYGTPAGLLSSLDRYLDVKLDEAGLTEDMSARLGPELMAAVAEAGAYLRALLQGGSAE